MKFLTAVTLIIFSTPALAYVGPGTGLSAIGSLIALLAAIIVAIFGFIWFPLKRILKARKNKDQDDEALEANSSEEDDANEAK